MVTTRVVRPARPRPTDIPGMNARAGVQPPILAASGWTIADGGAKNPYWMSRDRTRLYTGGSDTLYFSDDEGVTWTTLKSGFTTGITGVRELANGEILLGVAASGGTPGSLYLSSGYARLKTGSGITWTKVLDAGAGGIGPSSFFSGQWGMSAYENIVVVSEYGLQTPPTDSARLVYLSTDYGATWTQIFDLGTNASAHVHGVCYDPWWDAIWLVNGDTSANRNMRVSWDRGATWNLVSGGDATQYVGIVALPECILFTTDGPPNGVHRISRHRGRGTLLVEVAYRLNGNALISHVGMQPFQAAGTDMPVLLPFQAQSGNGIIVSTYDGFTYSTLWTDSATYTNKGPQYVVGPTVGGKYHATLTDDRQANASRLTATAAPSRQRAGQIAERDRAIADALRLHAPIGSSAANGALYLTAASSGRTAATRTNGNVTATPIYLPRACTLDRIGAETTIVGSAGALVRLGVWAADPISGTPTTLLLDAGTVDGTATPGFLEATIALNVGPGIIWVGGVVQGSPVTPPTIRLHTGGLGLPLPSTALNVTGNLVLGYLMTGVTGALTDWTTLGVNALPMAVAVRIKA